MIVFFDMDDTLYDRSLSFAAAMQEFFGGLPADPREAYRCCSARGNEVFLASQRGEISMDEFYGYRWGRGLQDVGVSISQEQALEFQQVYRSRQDCLSLSPVMERVLQYCASHAAGVGVITNGPSENQWNKIRRLGLERCMVPELILVSGDVGVDKPDPEIFRIAQRRCGAKPEELLYVGDSPENDIEPATACGWHTLWFNRNARPAPAELCPDAAAESEEALAAELQRILNGEIPMGLPH